MALVHVGTHKTGSTAFQYYIDEWRQQIFTDHGVVVHRGCFLPSHFELSVLTTREMDMPGRWLLTGHVEPMTSDEMRARVRETVESPADTVLFSAEDLCYLRTTAEVAELRALLAPREIVPILVLRDKTDFLASYRHSLQWMGYSGPSDDPSSVAYSEPDSWVADYDALLATMRLLSDDGTVHVLEYEAEVRRHGSIVPALARTCGIAPPLYERWDRRENISP